MLFNTSYMHCDDNTLDLECNPTGTAQPERVFTG